MTRTLLTLPDHCDAIALCGGAYSNFASVEAFLATTAGLPRFCLGDLGGAGPHPDRTIARLRESYVVCLQGNYDYAVGYGERDCGCGYVDPRDREYAQISYDYTAANTSEANKAWLRSLPSQIIIEWRGRRLLLVHGSPESVNTFVWESATDDATIDRWLATARVDAICATHSGVPWVRRTARGTWCNVGVLGRPAHDGTPRVGYALVHFASDRISLVVTLVPLVYDVAPVAAAIRAEGLPNAFAETLECGIWMTCANVLPDAERRIGDRYARSKPSSVRHARDAAPAQAD
ncbi:MAG TPA: metallophosphoesterase [Casimicrobiaceae bacterium]|nr:metallophosphoesterase [Casimicrobiaceae bacterium]